VTKLCDDVNNETKPRKSEKETLKEKHMKTVGMVVVLALVVLVPLSITTPVSKADGAVVIHDDGVCGMPGANANGDITFGGVGQVTHVVTNKNRQVFTCKGSDLTNLSGSGQHFEGFTCGTFAGLTTDTHATVSASGQGSMTCIVELP